MRMNDDDDPCTGDDSCTCDGCTIPCALCGEPMRWDDDIQVWAGPAVVPHRPLHRARWDPERPRQTYAHLACVERFFA